MNIIRLILKLLYKFTPIEEAEFGKVQEEAVDWYASIRIDDEAPKDAKYKLKKLAEQWYMKVVFAFGYVWLGRIIMDYMNGNNTNPEEESDSIFNK